MSSNMPGPPKYDHAEPDEIEGLEPIPFALRTIIIGLVVFWLAVIGLMLVTYKVCLNNREGAMDNDISFILEPKEFEQVLNALAQRPFVEVNGLLQKLVAQANQQIANTKPAEPQV